MINRCLLLKLRGSRKAMRRPRSSPASATAAKWVKPRVRTSRGASAMGKEYPGIPIPQITTGRSGSGSALQPRDQKLRKIALAFSNADAEAGATERLQSWCSQKMSPTVEIRSARSGYRSRRRRSIRSTTTSVIGRFSIRMRRWTPAGRAHLSRCALGSAPQQHGSIGP